MESIQTTNVVESLVDPDSGSVVYLHAIFKNV